ncbi:MAG: hypothetical protein WD075_03230 [Rhodospirillales bacterium]
MALCRSIFVAFAFFAAASQAHAACSPFPKSELLGEYSHAQVQNYVSKAHGGDWAPYLVALQKNLTDLERIQRADKGAVIKVKGNPTQIDSTGIDRFVYTSRQWLQVAQCLAEEQNVASLNDFSTASGGNGNVVETASGNGNTVTLQSEVASLSSDPLKVKITSSCDAGETVFKVVNAGSLWPSTGVFSIFRIDGPNRQMISARRMTLGAGDTKSFKVSKTQNMTGEVGMAIEPSWYKRPFQIDAVAQCK